MTPLRHLQDARAHGYALAAFNAVNLETAQAVVRAAEFERAPVVLQVSQNAARYAGLAELAAVGRVLRERASVPVLLHFDHAETPEIALEALALGFDGVMLEGDDPAVLRALADEAHRHGAFLEAEYEVVQKGERAGTQAELEDIATFARDSGCDLLAVALGSAHKYSRKELCLDFARLDAVAARTPLPLVLHGASSVSHAQLCEAATRGLSKMNVATELMVVFTDAVRTALDDAALHDPRRYLGAGRDAVTSHARQIIRALGGRGRAAS